MWDRSRRACRRFAGAITRGIGGTGANLDDGRRVTEREHEDIVKLGARLADAVGHRVVALDGHDVGLLEHVLYQQHTDHPDKLVITRRILFWERRATVTFDQVANVDPQRERVYLTIPKGSIEWAG